MRPYVEAVVALCCGCAAPQWANCQTIADYSRAQRTVMEAAVARSGERQNGPGQSTNGPGVPPPGPPVPPLGKAEALAEPVPDVLLTGIVAFGNRRVAEFTVDGIGHLLTAGDDVPDTAWKVKEVDRDRVRLMARSGARMPRNSSRTIFMTPGR